MRSQQIRESCSILPVNEWVERRRREWDEPITKMDAVRLFKISRFCRNNISRTSENKMEQLNLWLKWAEPPITRKRRRRQIPTDTLKKRSKKEREKDLENAGEIYEGRTGDVIKKIKMVTKWSQDGRRRNTFKITTSKPTVMPCS